MPGTYSAILLHIVFSTKGREPFITPEIRERLHEYMGEIVRGEKGAFLAIGSVEDHVHLLVRWRTDETLSTLMRRLKANSSLWIHQTFPDQRDFAWQEGYGAFSVSPSQVEVVRRYIEGQEERHRVRTFREEFEEMLRARGGV